MIRSVASLKSLGTRPRTRTSLAGLPLLPTVLIVSGALALLVLPLAAYRPQIVTVLLGVSFAYAWQPVAGVLGEMSMSHIIAWGAGMYALVLATNANWSLPAAMMLSAVIGLAVGVVAFGALILARVEGLYIAVFTLVGVLLVQAWVNASTGWLGGQEGLAGLNIQVSFEAQYVSLVAFSAVLMLGVARLLNSRRGLVWIAIRDDTQVASSLGWSPIRERFIAYAITSALCGFGGALQALTIAYVSPQSSLSMHVAVLALIALYVLGATSLWGPLLGTAFLLGLQVFLSGQTSDPDIAAAVTVAMYALALLVVIITMRDVKRKSIWLTGPSRSSELHHPTEVKPDVKAIEASVGARTLPPPRATGLGDARSRPLRVVNVEKSFGGNHVLRGVSFEVQPGEILGLVGPNGAGKSTLCNLIGGMIRPSRGDIYFGDIPQASKSPHQRARSGLGRTYQTPRVFGSLTLAENVAVAGSRVSTGDGSRLLRELGLNSPEKTGAEATLMERRLVEIARLLAVDRRWVLLDEPLAGLSLDEHEVILDLVASLARSGVSVLLIEHLIPVIAPRVDRMIVLEGGGLIADGKPAEVLRSPRVIASYLGEPLALTTEVHSA